MTMNFVVSCVVLMFAGFLLVVMGNDYCPIDPEYFSEGSGLRYYCGDICVNSDNQLCLKAKSLQCCPKNKYYNVTQLKLDLDDKSRRLNETVQKLDDTTKQRKKYEEENNSLKKENKDYWILTIVLGILTVIQLPFTICGCFYIRYKCTPKATSETRPKLKAVYVQTGAPEQEELTDSVPASAPEEESLLQNRAPENDTNV